MLVQGRWERSTFSPEDSMTDLMMTHKRSNLKNTLDHFEKWIGIVKVDNSFHSDKNCGLASEEMAEDVNSNHHNYPYCIVLYLVNLTDEPIWNGHHF